MAVLLILLLMSLSIWVLPAQAESSPVVTSRSFLQADLEQPTAVAVGKSGEIYVMDGVNGRVAVFDAQGHVSRSFGKSGSGDGQLRQPLDLALDGDWLAIADTGNYRIALFRTDGRFVRNISVAAMLPTPSPSPSPENKAPAASNPVASGEGDKSGDVAKPTPSGPPEPVAVSLKDGILAWSDRKYHRFCRLRLETGESLGCTGERGEQEGRFQYPYQLTQDRDGYYHVVDIVNARVQVFDKSGRFFLQISRFGLNPDELFRPNGLAIDREKDMEFIADSYFGTISVFKAGQYVDKLKDTDGEPIHLDSPTGLAWHDGRLYVAETAADRIVVLTVDYHEGEGSAKAAGKRIELSQKNCIICHLSWATEGPEAVRQPDPQGALPDASFRMCYSCHNGAIMDSRKAIGHGAQHPTVYEDEKTKSERKRLGKRKDKLPDLFPRTKDQQLQCTACHTPHNNEAQQQTLYSPHRNAWLRVPNHGGDLCERCHGSKVKSARETDPHKRGVNHPLAIKFEPPPNEEARGFPTNKALHKGVPEALRDHGSMLGNKRELVCQSCHQVHGGFGDRRMTVLTRDKGVLCEQCHDAQYAKDKQDARRKGVHPVNIKPDREVKLKGEKIEFLTCETCHKVHKGQIGTPLFPQEIENAEAMCKSCHERQHAENKDEALKKGVHPANHKLDEEVEIAGKQVKTMGCLTCHSVHHGKPDTPALVEEYRDGQLCSHCHANKQQVVGSDHDLRITAKDKKNKFDQVPHESGVCGACHTLHRGKGELPRLFAVKKVEGKPEPDGPDKADTSDLKNDALCLNCHQKGGISEKKVVKHFSHPHKDLILRSDKNSMPLLDEHEKVKEFGQIVCITCHEAHLWSPDKKLKPGEKVTLSTNKENLEGTQISAFLRHKGVEKTFCLECHGFEALVKFKYFHDKQRARDKGLDYIK